MGSEFLKKKPIQTVIVPASNEAILVVIDGHKRARYSPLIGVSIVPGIAVDINQLAQAWNKDSKELEVTLKEEALFAVSRFNDRTSRKKFNHLSLPLGLRAIELPEYFRQVSQTRETEMLPNLAYQLHRRR
jgi:hypothetical protein